MCKRFFDIISSLILLTVLSPVLISAAIAVVLESGFPALFLQQRVGRGGKAFTICKFRSMRFEARYVGSVPDGAGLSREQLAALRSQFKTTSSGDSRLTKVGRFLRRCYIDELPQLLNVLKGDMSLVGPRPDTPVQEVDYTPSQWSRRNSVRPGITGLAQVIGGKHNTPHRRISLDIMYTRRPTMCRDAWILWRTATHALFRGSY